jgi:hypothetical protein
VLIIPYKYYAQTATYEANNYTIEKIFLPQPDASCNSHVFLSLGIDNTKTICWLIRVAPSDQHILAIWK